MRQRKIITALLSTAALIFIIGSCKHEIPGLSGNGNVTTVGNTTDPCDPDKIYFEQQVLPILVSNCAQSGCHDNASRKEGVVLTSYGSVINTGGVNPGDAGGSKLYKLIVTTNKDNRMPPSPSVALTQQQINLIYNWIQQGAQNLICQDFCDSNTYSYNGAIKTIVQNKCQGCHSGTSAGGGIDLSTYTGVKTTVTNGKLWGSINQLPGYSSMPKNGARLSVCEITQFKKWMDAGSPNN